MATDPRDALNRLIAAFEHHFDTAQAGDRMDAHALEDAEERLRDAFFTYDDVLFTRLGVELPFDIVEEDDLEDEDFDEDDLEDEDVDETEISDANAD